MKMLNDEQRRALVESINQKISEGISTSAACKEFKVGLSNYYGWSKKFSDAKPNTTTVIYKPDPVAKIYKNKTLKSTRTKLTAVFGDARAIAELLQEMSRE